jgi:hypothetical protein
VISNMARYTTHDLKKDKDTITKIDIHEHRSKLKEKAFRKKELKVDKKSLFMDPIVELDDEQSKQFEMMTEFCRLMSRCPSCKTYVVLQNFSSTPDGGIRGLCSDCLNYITDESKQAKDFVTWLNTKVLEDYGLSFSDGFPKLLKHERKENWCRDCKAYHTTMQFYDYRDTDKRKIE